MAIETTCPGCGRTLRVDDSFAGSKARCPMCKHVYDVPTQSTSATMSSHSESWKNSDAQQDTAPHPGLQPLADSNAAPVLQPLSDFSPLSSKTSSSTSSEQPSSSSSAANTNNLFYVRVPSGQMYGPSDASTLREWAAQGRVNDTCDVRPANTEVWISYSSWLIQQNDRSIPKSNASTPRNIYGDNYGNVATPMNQTPTKQSGLGVLVCCLGVASWFLCFSIIGAPVCALVTIILAITELKKIANGQSPREERVLVHIGLWFAVANIVVCVGLFMLFVILGAISP